MRKISRVGPAAVYAAVLAAATLAAQEDALTTRARAIHERVMTLDTHVDINASNFTAECNYTRDLGNQVNLPKMIKGGLDAAFFIVYVGQGALTPEGYANAYRQASEKFDAIHRLTEEIAPDKIGLALTSADARRIYKSGKKVAFIGVENGYPIGDDIGARQGVPRSRRALPVARAQRPQPVVGFQHRRDARVAMERALAARQAGDRRS